MKPLGLNPKSEWSRSVSKNIRPVPAALLSAAVSFAWVLAPVLMKAQTISIVPSIVGTITDSTGAAVPGAVVTVTNPATGISNSAKTNDQGLYRVERLTLGTYNLSLKREGFKDIQSNGIVLSSGQELRSDYVLQVGSVGQSVTVAAAAPLINLENPQVANSFDFSTREYLPTSVPSGAVLPDFRAEQSFFLR
jgi:hypothetical protein